jgi:hypothetical protein
MPFAFEGTGQPLVTRAPPPPAAAGKGDVPTVYEQQTELVPNLTTRAHPDGGVDTTGDGQRAVRLTEAIQIVATSRQVSAVGHDVRDERDQLDIRVGRHLPDRLECHRRAVLARRENVDAARFGGEPSRGFRGGHDQIIEIVTQKRTEERLKSS